MTRDPQGRRRTTPGHIRSNALSMPPTARYAASQSVDQAHDEYRRPARGHADERTCEHTLGRCLEGLAPRHHGGMNQDEQTIDVAIGVELDHRGDLEDLVKALPKGNVLEAHGLDGQAILTFVATLHAASIPVVIAWIRGRTQQRRNMFVVIDGHRFNGYTHDEVVRIIDALQALEHPAESRPSDSINPTE
jgi:hypothetical protein